MHYYSHHIGDFIRDTSRLTDSQCMAYMRLMWLYYESEEPLPQNTELLAFKIGSDFNTVDMLLQCYFYANALRWHHKRIDSELLTYKTKSKKASDSAKSRWNHANALQTQCEGNANQEPITNNHKPIVIKKEKTTSGAIACPPDVDKSVFADFLQIRKAKRSPLTQTALDGLKREASKAGITLEDALRVCITRGWQGFNADWVKDTPVKATAHTGFANKNYSEGISDDGRIL